MSERLQDDMAVTAVTESPLLAKTKGEESETENGAGSALLGQIQVPERQESGKRIHTKPCFDRSVTFPF